MPVYCAVEFPKLKSIQMREIDYRVMAHAYCVQNKLGRLCDEFNYKKAILSRLRANGFQVIAEMPIELTFRNFNKTLHADMVVQRVVYELKVATSLTPTHECQVLTYLMLVNAQRGKLINFRPQRVQSRFVNQLQSREQRLDFCVHDAGWTGDASFAEMAVALLRDWGTGLSQQLYLEAMTVNLGGELEVLRRLPLTLEDQPIGHQRFLMAKKGVAFDFTSFKQDDLEFEATHLQKLVKAAGLDAFYWVNATQGHVTLRTIT